MLLLFWLSCSNAGTTPSAGSPPGTTPSAGTTPGTSITPGTPTFGLSPTSTPGFNGNGANLGGTNYELLLLFVPTIWLAIRV